MRHALDMPEIEEGFDVVILTGATGDSRLQQRPLGQFGWRLVASPDYVARRGTPAVPADLTNHVCLRQQFSSGRLIPWELRAAPDLRLPDSLTASIIDALLDLTVAGAGIGSFPEFLVRDGLARDSLVPILDGEIGQTGVVTMLWPASRYRVPKVRAFVDCIAQYNRLESDRRL
jgi:DNA-binding transcriptional LysR family regulator